MVVISRPVDEKIEDELQALDEQFQELKNRMSELRKKGKDTSIAELLAYDFAPKLRMAKVTYEKDDIGKIRGLLDEISSELKESEEGSDFSHVLELIKEAYDFLRNNKMHEAMGAYSALISKYKKLPKDLQRAVYRAALDIRKKIQQYGSS